MNERVVYFNGLDLDKPWDGTPPYRLSPRPIADLLDKPPAMEDPELALNGKDVMEGVDPNRLDQAGWGFIVHERENPEILEALEPLLKKREADAGANFRKLEFKTGDTPHTFLQRYGAGRGDANPSKLPYYLLIVGSPELIPFSFQTDMDVSYAVGRLSFRNPSGYAGYAANVLRHEEAPKRDERQLHLFGPHNGEPLTALSRDRLVAPIRDRLSHHSILGPESSWSLRSTPAEEATRERLGSLLSPEKKPDILFTASHGVVCGEHHARRERLQGGLVCSDWQAGAPVSERHCFFGHDVTSDMDLSGLICFFFSCFTAGTPSREISCAPDRKADVLHPHSFVGSLPQAILDHERGALAVIGHVEQCFQHSFLWHEEIGETDHFVSALARMMGGETVGRAMEHFNRRLADIATVQLGRMYDPVPPSEAEMQLFWLTFQDARYYIVLGDPAVRL